MLEQETDEFVEALVGALIIIYRTPTKDRETHQIFREAIREYGIDLASRATLPEMLELAHVASSKAPNSCRALTTIDAQWDGIRAKDNRTWYR